MHGKRKKNWKEGRREGQGEWEERKEGTYMSASLARKALPMSPSFTPPTSEGRKGGMEGRKEGRTEWEEWKDGRKEEMGGIEGRMEDYNGRKEGYITEERKEGYDGRKEGYNGRKEGRL